MALYTPQEVAANRDREPNPWRPRLPIGAECLGNGQTVFRVWAPDHRRVELLLVPSPASAATDSRPSRQGSLDSPEVVPMRRESNGYFSMATTASAGTRYLYRLDGGESFPDPASRFQPDGPLGPSQVVDPGMFAWTDGEWRGVRLAGQALYELHIGTFTPEGTWQAASEQLPALADLGVTCLEILPIADWSGSFGWGYDGVNLFAPTRLYGSPDDFRRFVDRAHAVGLGVILDVVYNHFGSRDCTVQQFAADYVSGTRPNIWGAPMNFDGPRSESVREFVLSNARYWIEEFHLDGFRIDASQAIEDDSPRHILSQIGAAARGAAGGRSILIIAENEPQDTRLARPLADDGYGLDSLWNEDFHHSAMVCLTGCAEAYYSDHRGVANEFVALVKWGFLFQGQRYSWQGQRRGTPAFDLPPAVFVNYLQNHDQVANTGVGRRVHELAPAGRLRAMTGLLLLMPQTPLLFQGQEFAASAPFCYFQDCPAADAPGVAAGRREFLSQFRSLALPEVWRQFPDPADPDTFARCKLDFGEREKHGEWLSLHKDLLALRRDDPVLGAQRRERLDAAALDRDALVVRYFDEQNGDRLLVVNFGRDLHFEPAPEPLLAPPFGRRWAQLWSSEDPRYGGRGAPELDTDEGWRIPADATVLLRAESIAGEPA